MAICTRLRCWLCGRFRGLSPFSVDPALSALLQKVVKTAGEITGTGLTRRSAPSTPPAAITPCTVGAILPINSGCPLGEDRGPPATEPPHLAQRPRSSGSEAVKWRVHTSLCFHHRTTSPPQRRWTGLCCRSSHTKLHVSQLVALFQKLGLGCCNAVLFFFFFFLSAGMVICPKSAAVLTVPAQCTVNWD